MKFPRYKCKKEVSALKIKKIELRRDPADSSVTYGVITPEEAGFSKFIVSAGYLSKHEPQAGGYFVVYDGPDKYQSYSPAEPFETGYDPIP